MQEYTQTQKISEYDRSDETGLNAVKMFFQRYFHFQGYSSLREYLWTLFILGGILLVMLFFFRLGFYVFSPFIILFIIIAFMPTFSLLSRRLADAGIPRLIVMIMFLAFIPQIPLFIQVSTFVINGLLGLLPSKTQKHDL